MSSYQEDPATPESAEARAEAAATRRRWLTLAEVVAIAGVVIAALTLWNNWQGREADQAQRAAEEARTASAARASTIVTFAGIPKDDGGKLALKDPSHTIQSIEVRFPSALHVTPQSSTIDLTIDAGWFEDALISAIRNGSADQQGRLPVIITADYWNGDQHMVDVAIYDIIWQTHRRFLRGRALELKGLVLERRHNVTQAAVDALWAKQSRR